METLGPVLSIKKEICEKVIDLWCGTNVPEERTLAQVSVSSSRSVLKSTTSSTSVRIFELMYTMVMVRGSKRGRTTNYGKRFERIEPNVAQRLLIAVLV